MEALDGVEVIAFPDAAAWETWLAENHELQAGVWLKLAKKGSGIFDSLDKTSQYRLYLPVLQSTSPKVRAARLRKMVGMLEAEKKPRRR